MDEIKSFAQGRPQHTDDDNGDEEEDEDDEDDEDDRTDNDEEEEDDDDDGDEIKSFTQGQRSSGVTTKIEVSILIMMMKKKMITMILMMVLNKKIKILPNWLQADFSRLWISSVYSTCNTF